MLYFSCIEKRAFMKKTLWTKNFTIITIGTIISCVGGVAMNLAFIDYIEQVYQF